MQISSQANVANTPVGHCEKGEDWPRDALLRQVEQSCLQLCPGRNFDGGQLLGPLQGGGRHGPWSVQRSRVQRRRASAVRCNARLAGARGNPVPQMNSPFRRLQTRTLPIPQSSQTSYAIGWGGNKPAECGRRRHKFPRNALSLGKALSAVSWVTRSPPQDDSIRCERPRRAERERDVSEYKSMPLSEPFERQLESRA